MQRRYERELVEVREQEILEGMNWRLNDIDQGLMDWERLVRVREIKEEARLALVGLGPQSEMGVGLAEKRDGAEKDKKAI